MILENQHSWDHDYWDDVGLAVLLNELDIKPTGGDRFDTLALQFYGDSSLWWVIASANTSVRDSIVVKPGVQLRIPLSKTRVLDLYRTANSNR